MRGDRLAIMSLSSWLGVAGLATADGIEETTEAPMVTGESGWHTVPLLTVGEFVCAPGGGSYQLTGRPDGLGALLLDATTLRIYINHEISEGDGTTVLLANGTELPSGARISFLDVDRATRTIVEGGQAIQAIVDWTGDCIDVDDLPTFGVLRKLCSSSLYGAAEGFAEDLYLTGEEKGGGRAFALDVATGTLYEMADFGNGRWENFAVIPTAGTRAEGKTVALLADDTPGRPAYLYIGDRQRGSPDFLARNGLVGGQLHVFVADDGSNTNQEFDGTGNQLTGTWVAIQSNDPFADNTTNMDNMVDEAGGIGAFFFSRPEDVATNPLDPASGEVVLASTGRCESLGDIDGDGFNDFLEDPWGTTYLVQVDLDSVVSGTITGSLRILYDGNETGDFGLRNPDNLDWSDDGFVYIQEDPEEPTFGQASGREASIWRLDVATSEVVPVAEMDRSAVPAGQSDSDASTLGAWESSGILDVSEFFDKPAGELFVLDVQAHSITDGIIEADNLVEGGQILFLSRCVSDITSDGAVNVPDLLALLTAFGDAGGPADINGDGTVDVLDLLVLLGAWGPC